jgi:hypothetical protein
MVDRGTDFTFAAMAALVVALVAGAFFWPVDPSALNSPPQALLNVYERVVSPV